LGIGAKGRTECFVRRVFHQPETKERRRYPENNIVGGHLGGEVGLRQGAAPGVGATGNREKIVHAAIGRSVRIIHETRFAYRAIRGDERRHGVVSAVQGRKRHLRIGGRTAATDGRRRMTSGTAIAVEARTQSVGDRVDIFEPCLRSVKKIHFVGGQAGDRTSGAGRAASDTRIDGL
jgi:hypothetical protein